MTTSTAHVLTDRPSRYAKQLVAHLSRRSRTGWDEATGRGFVEFDNGRAELTAVDGALDLRIDGDDPDRFENVIGRHLVRFGTKDELTVMWKRDDGTRGTAYRNPTDETIGDH